jgi:hypothetical protein
MKKIITLVLLALGIGASVAHAHGVWIAPSSTILSAPQFVTFDAASSSVPFMIDHRPLVIDLLTISAPDGSKVTPVNVMKGELRTVFDAKLEQQGTYRLELYALAFVQVGKMPRINLSDLWAPQRLWQKKCHPTQKTSK